MFQGISQICVSFSLEFHRLQYFRGSVDASPLQENLCISPAVSSKDKELLAIRNGAMAWEEVNKWRLDLHKIFDNSLNNTSLPERPNYEKANALLIEARKEMVAISCKL